MTLAGTLGCQALAFLGYFLYCSFFEWFFHKFLFHKPHVLKATFKAHALIHHTTYGYEPHHYQWHEDEGNGKNDPTKEHIAMDWFALPLFIGVHLPAFFAVQWLTGIPSVWGGVAAVTTYYFVYEYFHYAMHIPSGKWFERTPVFQFVKEHHRIHHKFMMKNFNVFFPLADLCLGTFRSPAQAEAMMGQTPRQPVATVTPTGSGSAPTPTSRPAERKPARSQS